MAKNFDAILPKIIPLLRMLISSADGEVINAARALQRTLAGSGLDIHALVERIEHGTPLDAGEMQKIYDAAYQKGHTDGSEQGRRSAVLATAQPAAWHLSNQSIDDGVNGYTWAQIAEHCVLNKHLFRGRDLEFIESVFEQLSWGKEPSAPQAKWLRDLFMRKFGGSIT